MVDLKDKLKQLHANLNILKERKAKYAGDAPLVLINQIEDYKKAIKLTEQAKEGKLSEIELREKMKPLMVSLREKQVIIDQHGQQVNTQVNVAGNLIIYPQTPITKDTGGDKTFQPSLSPSSYLPPKIYGHFVGRSETRDQVLGALSAPEHQPMTALVGLGGIGKTALAREVVDRCWSEELFECIVWISFKEKYFANEKISSMKATASKLEAVYNEIGRQCDSQSITQALPEDKVHAVRNLLATRKILIVLDNLEAVSNKEDLVDNIFQILGQSKLLITSRHGLRNEQILTIGLSGLPIEDGVMFLQKNSEERGIEVIARAEKKQLQEIHEVTGGAPLAMKLVIGQMSRLPMDVVLKTLQDANVQGKDEQFYRFVYQYSWDLLGADAQETLVDLSVFPPTVGGAKEDVEAISSLEPSLLWTAIGDLITFSLVDKTGSIGAERFALHPLTLYFVLSDITGEWAVEQ